MSQLISEVRASLIGNFRGDLLLPADAEFEDAQRIWNAMVARKPALIARCADAADVQTVVRVASSAGALTAIRCGGHSLAGFSTCDDGLVVDLSRLKGVRVDAPAKRARFGGGCLLETIDTATQKAGLAFPSGVVSHTGAAGLVLGGGTGWLNRLHGLSCDNVDGFTLVVADGSLVRANAKENADLFWALRGGGGNFGVVTEFEVKLHPVSSVLFGAGFCAGEDIAPILRHWRDFMPEASDNLRWGISLTIAPDAPNVPPRLRGRPVASQGLLWVGDRDVGSRHLRRALSLCNCQTASQREMSFLELQTMADHEFPHGRRYYTKSGYFRSLGDGEIERMVAALETTPSAANQIELAYLGGAAGRVGASETAFGDRSSPFIVNFLGNWSDAADDAANIAWVRKLFVDLRRSMVPGVYVNFMSGDEQDRVPEAYRERWDRLVAVKTHYDPNNFFRLNQNIAPQRAATKDRSA
ncbi:MAG TPA: FAD-dependent oxidoreductase [Candidatus Methylomirabilis sp.]|nr:FAD-dependent oxidoreductase [Candidatus Methylomirabilis sp.]